VDLFVALDVTNHAAVALRNQDDRRP
jgi:hypothetical protein